MKYLLVCALFVFSLPSLLAQNACIEGHVLDTSGAPIGGVHVTGAASTKEISFDVTAASEGFFRANGIPAGKYAMAIKDEPNSSAELNIAIATEKECGAVTLHRPVRARIHLTTSNLLTGESIHDVTAAYYHGDKRPWTYIAQEEKDILVSPQLDLQLLIGARGYEISTITLPALQPGEQRELPVLLRPMEMGCIHGRVVDAQGKPVAGASVLPRQMEGLLSYPIKRAISDKNGEFQLELLQPGWYSLLTDVSPTEYTLIPQGDRLKTLAVQPGAGCHDITINLGPKAAHLKVAVIDAHTQQQLKNFDGSITGTGDHHWTLNMIAKPLLVPSSEAMNISINADGYRAAKTEIGPLQPEETREVRVELIAK